MHKHHLWQLGGSAHDHWAMTGMAEKSVGYCSENEEFYLLDCQISPLLVLFFSQCLQEAKPIFTYFAHLESSVTTNTFLSTFAADNFQIPDHSVQLLAVVHTCLYIYSISGYFSSH